MVGCNNDYRGVPVVVGAWTWLHEYDFGVATEIDMDPSVSTDAIFAAFVFCFALVDWNLCNLFVTVRVDVAPVERTADGFESKSEEAWPVRAWRSHWPWWNGYGLSWTTSDAASRRGD